MERKTLLLTLAALLLFSWDLGALPLRDWDEGTVATVAREIWQSPHPLITLIHPTIFGQPYLNKPPLIHGLIALAYGLGGVNEWTTRLPPALVSAVSVPLVYGVGREIFGHDRRAWWSALVYLTLLPLVRHGRLAMLDGAVVCFFTCFMWCLLRSHRQRRSLVGLGISLALIGLTKGAMLALLLGGLGVLFLAWSAPQQLRLSYLWVALGLGMMPVGLWYGAQWCHYGDRFLQTHVVSQSFSRIWIPVGSQTGPPWYYLLELLKYAWPWLPFALAGFALAWQQRHQDWAKLVLVWGGGYLLAISTMVTKLPWYILPVYPAIALGTGAYLDHLDQRWRGDRHGVRGWWCWLLGILALGCWAGFLYLIGWHPTPEPDLQGILGTLALTLTLATGLALGRHRYFAMVLVGGLYGSLLLLFSSQHWIWELQEAYPVQPVARLVQGMVPPQHLVYTSYPHTRPSLNFYSHHQVIPATPDDLKRYWQEDEPYLLVQTDTLPTFNFPFPSLQILGQAGEWSLVTQKDSWHGALARRAGDWVEVSPCLKRPKLGVTFTMKP